MKKKRLFIAGDSTACLYPHCGEKNRFPRTGWGQVVGRFLNDVEVIDLALSGRSSKSFKTEENYKILKNEICSGDYLVIQFGHNDAKSEDPSRYTSVNDGTYSNSIMEFVNIARMVGANPILATSISRNKTSDPKLEEYVDAIRLIAIKKNLPLMDLYKATNDYINRVGTAKGSEMFMILEPHDKRFINDPRFNGSEFYNKYTIDNTHLNINGALIVAQFAADMLTNIMNNI